MNRHQKEAFGRMIVHAVALDLGANRLEHQRDPRGWPMKVFFGDVEVGLS